jgi:hypothetical protein
MGWNSWNSFACNINEQLIRDTADAMVKLGSRMPATSTSTSTTAGTASATGWRDPSDAERFLPG